MTTEAVRNPLHDVCGYGTSRSSVIQPTMPTL